MVRNWVRGAHTGDIRARNDVFYLSFLTLSWGQAHNWYLSAVLLPQSFLSLWSKSIPLTLILEMTMCCLCFFNRRAAEQSRVQVQGIQMVISNTENNLWPDSFRRQWGRKRVVILTTNHIVLKQLPSAPTCSAWPWSPGHREHLDHKTKLFICTRAGFICINYRFDLMLIEGLRDCGPVVPTCRLSETSASYGFALKTLSPWLWTRGN